MIILVCLYTVSRWFAKKKRFLKKHCKAWFIVASKMLTGANWKQLQPSKSSIKHHYLTNKGVARNFFWGGGGAETQNFSSIFARHEKAYFARSAKILTILNAASLSDQLLTSTNKLREAQKILQFFFEPHHSEPLININSTWYQRAAPGLEVKRQSKSSGRRFISNLP